MGFSRSRFLLRRENDERRAANADAAPSRPRATGVPCVAVITWMIMMTMAPPAGAESVAAERTARGLRVFYDFAETGDERDRVRDRSGTGEPLDLVIERPDAVARPEGGGLLLRGESRIGGEASAMDLHNAVRRTGEISIEAWFEPADLEQSGPARIVTLSKNSGERNFTLGQDGDKVEVRLRTDRTTKNGNPALATEPGSLRGGLTHMVYTRTRGGRARIYLNGEPSAEGTIPGSVSTWDPSYRLGIGDEHADDRPWRGRLRLVGVFERALTEHEVRAHFAAGPNAGPGEREAAPDPNALAFVDEIEPILARHCLECHDAANRKGKLDLSTRAGALAGGPDGPVIVPGDPDASRLFETVRHDEMPEDRDPLSDAEKQALRRWIEGGARWPVDELDPLAHKRDDRAADDWVRRLTVAEYIETVRAAVGVDIAAEARETLPPDLRADGFHNTAYNLGVDFAHVEAYASLAETIVDRMDVLAFARRFHSKLAFEDDSMGALIEKMGRWILRGPVEEREIVTYRGISTSVASAGGTIEEAAGLIVEAMLQSPRFLYRIENQAGDGTRWPVSAHELASRLGYLVWGAPADEELARLADEGALADPEVVRSQVVRMLEDPRAVRRSEHFLIDWLNLGRLASMRPDPDKYPDWDPALAADMREETLAFFRELVWAQGRPLHELLNAQFTHLTPRLAAHYGLPAMDGPSRVDLGAVPERGGLLTQASVLTIGGDDASMVTRGLFVLHELLRSGVNDPPPGVDTTPQPSRPGQSHRQVAELRIADRSCGGCHGKFEPLAFGLERFDGLGRYAETDRHGNALRHDGEILFPGSAEATPYGSAAELMDLLADSERVRSTITWKLVQFAIGRPLTAADRTVVEKIHVEAAAAGGTYQAAITAIALSDFVQTTPTEPTAPSSASPDSASAAASGD